jgi:hypothetical protein
MNGTRGWGLFSLSTASVLLVLSASSARSQEIRRVAEPFEQVRMARGGYVCDGKLTVSPIDNTYDTVSCSGPMYNAADYAAVYTKLSRDELAEMNANNRAALNRDLKAAIHGQFQSLPTNLRQLAAIQTLEKGLMDSVDEKLPEGRGNNRGPRSGGSAPASAPTSPPPAQE